MGVRSTVHFVPFHRSASVTTVFGTPDVPTAVHALGEVHDTPSRLVVTEGVGSGVDWIVYSLPFHLSASGASVEPHDLQGPLRTLDAKGVHQRRTRPALRGDRASRQAARLRPQTGQVPGDHRPADRHGRPLHQHARLRRDRIPARRHPRPAPRTLHARSNPYGRDRHQRPPDSGALAAARALAVAPQGFTVAQFTAQVRAMTGQAPEDYSVRQGATTCASYAAKSPSSNPGAPAATTYPRPARAPSPPC